MKRIVLTSLASIGVVLAAASLVFVGHTQSLPAPTVGRVGFPAGYQNTYKLFYVFDNYQNRQIRKVYGNSIAASVTPPACAILTPSHPATQRAPGQAASALSREARW